MLFSSRSARRCTLAGVVAAATLAASTSFSSAAAISWNGTTSGNWSVATNFTPNQTPSVDPANPDALTLPSTTGTRTMTNDLTGVQLQSIAITSGLYTLAGNAITFTGTNPTYTNSAGGSGDAIVNSEAVTLSTTATFSSTGATRLTFSGDINGSGGLTIGGTGTVRLQGVAKTYTGDTTISSGTLDLVTINNLLPAGVGKGNVTIAATGTLLDENVNVDINGLNGSGNITRNTGSNTRGITIGDNNASGTFTGNITNAAAATGAYSLTKIGTGTQALGNVTINSSINANVGTLLLNGAITAASSTQVAGSTLGGNTTETLTGAYTANGTLAPGNQGVGAMSISTTAAALNSASTLAIEIGGNTAATGYDQLNFTNAAGTVTLNAAAALTATIVGGYTPTSSDVDYILTRADAGTFANGFAGLPEGATVAVGADTAQITYLANWTGSDATSTLTGGNDIALFNFQAPAATPEPASLGLLALGAVSLLTRRRK